MIWSATAPSNIALIKYMGKADSSKDSSSLPVYAKNQKSIQHLSKEDQEDFLFKNLSLNPSLSYTLNHFVTQVQIEESDKDKWLPFKKNPFPDNIFYSSSKKTVFESKMPDTAQKKFLDFFLFLKRFFFIPGNYIIRSQNNFPMSAGAASSASSFAALTLATYRLAKDHSSLNDRGKEALSELSRIGSGSSCRSFFSPWSLWTGRSALPFKETWGKLFHQLVIVDSQIKKVSSTTAHKLVKTSPAFKGRTDRVKKRLKTLSSALQKKDWKPCFKVCYEEFMDMHSLFETASPPFKYKTSSSEKVLGLINEHWKKNNDGPLVTMDAGSNIHLLYRPDQRSQKEKITKLLTDYTVLSSL